MMNVPPESERIRQNFLKRQDQLHFAEECAYSADRQNTTSAVQIARRLNEATTSDIPDEHRPSPRRS